MRSFASVRFAGFVAIMMVLCASPARAQDPAKTDPAHFKVELENDRVRVLHVTVAPNTKIELHELDDAVNILTGAYQNSHNPILDYASGDIDVRHNFTLGAVWDIPTASSLPKRLGQGWQISSLLQARSGLPYTIALAAPFFGTDQIRPNVVPGVSVRPSNYSVPDNQLNPGAFSAPPNGKYGDLGRNTGRGPGFTQWDASFAKTTLLTEKLRLQFRGELFNLFNHPNFANPVNFLNDANFGKSTATIANHVGTGTSRQGQLVLKLIF